MGMEEPDPEDRRLNAPTFHRNHIPILVVLRQVLAGRSGHVVEIGAGSGQHVHAYAEAMPEFIWWPTDISPRHLESIDAWRAHCDAENLMPPVVLDASEDDWRFGQPGRPPAEDLTAMFSANVIHISPFAVARGIIAAAGRHLGADGVLLFYGPFMRDGVHTAESNARFDVSLRAENPDWGVRDMADLGALAADHGLEMCRAVEMPANNFVLVYERVG